nr:MAG TPA: hypothetical protein [Caudoviricetes sp.]
MHEITVSLNSGSLTNAVRELKKYQKWVREKTDLLAEKLAVIGASEASIRFARAQYDGEKQAEISVEPIENGWKIVARGDSVFFIEFGAGVYFNGAEPYPEPRPEGVSNIGEYGQGKGKQNTWGYYGPDGELVLTHGTPAAMPMYHASREMEQEILRIAREVFR